MINFTYVIEVNFDFVVFDTLRGILDQRIMIIDGAMGTQIQEFELVAEDFRGILHLLYYRKLFITMQRE